MNRGVEIASGIGVFLTSLLTLAAVFKMLFYYQQSTQENTPHLYLCTAVCTCNGTAEKACIRPKEMTQMAMPQEKLAASLSVLQHLRKDGCRVFQFRSGQAGPQQWIRIENLQINKQQHSCFRTGRGSNPN
jgi:hypothetical protein